MEASQEVWIEVRRLVDAIGKLRLDLQESLASARTTEPPPRYWELRREMDGLASKLVTVSMRYHSKVKSEWFTGKAPDKHKPVSAGDSEVLSPAFHPKPRPA